LECFCCVGLLGVLNDGDSSGDDLSIGDLGLEGKGLYKSILVEDGGEMFARDL